MYHFQTPDLVQSMKAQLNVALREVEKYRMRNESLKAALRTATHQADRLEQIEKDVADIKRKSDLVQNFLLGTFHVCTFTSVCILIFLFIFRIHENFQRQE